MLKARTSERMIVLFMLGWALLNFPLLLLWDHEATVFGVPLFAAGLFLIWGGLIIALAWMLESNGQ
ncbi:hypothetical protein [Neptunomonas qingdaonensis]|uniref:Solute:sodium symporter small subunit n=1 Tax=Neptunomonas qingdaonensis TaxID=1045558 RepID=A0A1I2N780_9GAMM|nr:hypothetical protein [Neptunomonas qingdaonensis]SFF97221.1 hypothetical protein SAMN05216175_102211 [Neptunomonas qingdaonensis]